MNSYRLFGVLIVGLVTVSLLGSMIYFYGSNNDSLVETNDTVKVDDREGLEETKGSDDETGLVEVATPDDTSETGNDQEREERNIEGRYKVLNVYDGDTFTVNYNGTETSVRIIGVNTPETVDPRKTVECFGEQASLYLKNKLFGREVDLERDYTQDNRDKYNRLLRYAYLDGEDVGYDIIYNGYGHEYTYYIPYEKQSKYKEAEKDAELNGRGLWEDGVCGPR